MLDKKRGQGLSTNAIVLIVLGIVVLVVLILGFTMGWRNLAPWISGDDVEKVSEACNIACATNSVRGFCNEQRSFTDEKKNEIAASCFALSEIPELKKRYSITGCSSITCTNLEKCEEVFKTASGIVNIEVNKDKLGTEGAPGDFSDLKPEPNDKACDAGAYDLTELAGNTGSATPYCCMAETLVDQFKKLFNN